MLSCRELTELVTDYLEDKLASEEKMSFQQHMGLCKHCRVYITQMKQTVLTLGKVPEHHVMPEEVCNAFRQQFQNWRADPDGE